MLGETLSDPYDVEEGGSMKGMGLLPIETVFTKEKTRTRVRGTIGTIQDLMQGFPEQRQKDMKSIWERLS